LVSRGDGRGPGRDGRNGCSRRSLRDRDGSQSAHVYADSRCTARARVSRVISARELAQATGLSPCPTRGSWDWTRFSQGSGARGGTARWGRSRITIRRRVPSGRRRRPRPSGPAAVARAFEGFEGLPAVDSPRPLIDGGSGPRSLSASGAARVTRGRSVARAVLYWRRSLGGRQLARVSLTRPTTAAGRWTSDIAGSCPAHGSVLGL